MHDCLMTVMKRGCKISVPGSHFQVEKKGQPMLDHTFSTDVTLPLDHSPLCMAFNIHKCAFLKHDLSVLQVLPQLNAAQPNSKTSQHLNRVFHLQI